MPGSKGRREGLVMCSCMCALYSIARLYGLLTDCTSIQYLSLKFKHMAGNT